MSATPQKRYSQTQLKELLYLALETETSGLKVYKTALSCAQDDDLKREWQECLEQTQTHQQVLLNVFAELGLNPDVPSPGREVVAHIGEALITALIMAKTNDSAEAAQWVASECVGLTETKAQQNWQLIGHLAEHGLGAETAVLKTAFSLVDSKARHHSQTCVRELWLQALGITAALPASEEVKKVETASGAARAESRRDALLQPNH